MLVKLEKTDFEKYVGQAYEMALIPEITSYPVYYDGVKTKEDYRNRAKNAFFCDHEEILLFYLNGSFSGWIHTFYLPEDRYLDTVSLSARVGMEQMLEEFLDYVRSRYPDACIYLGFPEENRTATGYLRKHGFTIEEQSWNMVLPLSPGAHAEAASAFTVRIGKENYPLFRRIHSAHEDGMYWTSEKILNRLDDWLIFVFLRQGQPAAAAYCQRGKLSEIFGVDFDGGNYDPAIHRELLAAIIHASRDDGGKNLVYFCGDKEKAVAAGIGFSTVGKYVLLQKQP